jgi:hypothetical protein
MSPTSSTRRGRTSGRRRQIAQASSIAAGAFALFAIPLQLATDSQLPLLAFCAAVAVLAATLDRSPWRFAGFAFAALFAADILLATIDPPSLWSDRLIALGFVAAAPWVIGASTRLPWPRRIVSFPLAAILVISAVEVALPGHEWGRLHVFLALWLPLFVLWALLPIGPPAAGKDYDAEATLAADEAR